MKPIRWLGGISLLLSLNSTSTWSGNLLFGGAHEQVAQEPNVIYENDLFKMWYTSGWERPQLNYATSMDGLTWTQYAGNPVLGNGGSGYSGAFVAHTGLVKFDGTYYLYFADSNYGNWMRSTSGDGIRWTAPVQVFAANAYPWAIGWANSTLWQEGNTWYAMLEARVTTPQIWRLTLWTSADGLTWRLLSNPFLTTLEANGVGGASGPFIRHQGGQYQLWYHGTLQADALPTSIFYATSTDLLHWESMRLLSPTGVLPEGDQVADPSPVIIGDQVLLYYEGVDNASATSVIEVRWMTAPMIGKPLGLHSENPYTQYCAIMRTEVSR